MMKVHINIPVYEIDGRDKDANNAELTVRSHWNETGSTGKVVLLIEGKNYTVAAQDIQEAVSRCIGFRT